MESKAILRYAKITPRKAKRVADLIKGKKAGDALISLRSRQPMIPLTEAAIEFRVGADVVREPATAVVVNRDLVDWVREGAPVYDRSEVPWS